MLILCIFCDYDIIYHKWSAVHWNGDKSTVWMVSIDIWWLYCWKLSFPGPADASAGKLHFQQYNHQPVVTIQIVYVYPHIKFRSAAVEKSKISQPIKSLGGHSVVPIGLKNINLVEDVHTLLSVMFGRILFNSFREEVENVLSNHTTRLQHLFSDRPEKHKLGRGH